MKGVRLQRADSLPQHIIEFACKYCSEMALHSAPTAITRHIESDLNKLFLGWSHNMATRRVVIGGFAVCPGDSAKYPHLIRNYRPSIDKATCNRSGCESGGMEMWGR
jgi:hypothetical protein